MILLRGAPGGGVGVGEVTRQYIDVPFHAYCHCITRFTFSDGVSLMRGAGNTKVLLDGERENVRNGETNLVRWGGLICLNGPLPTNPFIP